jgi:hypothetical protein
MPCLCIALCRWQQLCAWIGAPQADLLDHERRQQPATPKHPCKPVYCLQPLIPFVMVYASLELLLLLPLLLLFVGCVAL